METPKKVSSANVNNRCRLCGEIAPRKVWFFAEAGKSQRLKDIVSKECGVCVEETDDLPKFCCRSCHDKVVRLNNNIESFPTKFKNTQAKPETERESNRIKRCRNPGTPVSCEKPAKQPCIVERKARKSLFQNGKENASLPIATSTSTAEKTYRR